MAEIGSIVAHLNLDTTEWDKAIRRVRRQTRWGGLRDTLLAAYCGAVTVACGVLAVLDFTH